MRDAHFAQVASDAVQPVTDLFVTAENDECRRAVLGLFRAAEKQTRELRGLLDCEVARVEHRDGVVAEAIGERGEKRGAPFFFVQVRDVTAGLRAEDHAAVHPLRRTNRTLARAAGALLAPRLASAAADFIALLRRSGAGARVGEFAINRAKDRVLLVAVFLIENFRRLLFANDLSGCVDNVRHSPPPSRSYARPRVRSSDRGSGRARAASCAPCRLSRFPNFDGWCDRRRNDPDGGCL